jgi:hypothetical protein
MNCLTFVLAVWCRPVWMIPNLLSITEHYSGLNNLKNCLRPTYNKVATTRLQKFRSTHHSQVTTAPWLYHTSQMKFSLNKIVGNRKTHDATHSEGRCKMRMHVSFFIAKWVLCGGKQWGVCVGVEPPVGSSYSNTYCPIFSIYYLSLQTKYF